jgi:predicted unusual protein kinase regulating ubiquinone biosynthesis (AarF/ABC1/UbiB family)
MSVQRIGLIDYGQVKRLTDDIRTSFARLIIALWRDDRPEVVRIMQQVLYCCAAYCTARSMLVAARSMLVQCSAVHCPFFLCRNSGQRAST